MRKIQICQEGKYGWLDAEVFAQSALDNNVTLIEMQASAEHFASMATSETDEETKKAWMQEAEKYFVTKIMSRTPSAGNKIKNNKSKRRH